MSLHARIMREVLRLRREQRGLYDELEALAKAARAEVSDVFVWAKERPDGGRTAKLAPHVREQVEEHAPMMAPRWHAIRARRFDVGG